MKAFSNYITVVEGIQSGNGFQSGNENQSHLPYVMQQLLETMEDCQTTCSNCEQRTLTSDDKCQGSTHTPYKVKGWEQLLQSVQKMATHWCPDTHVLCTNHM